jgi:SOS-response transcriptional repressor LexA
MPTRRKKFEQKLIEWNNGEWYGAGARLVRDSGKAVTKNVVSSWVNGKSKPEDKEKVERVARTLGVSFKEFMSWFGDGADEEKKVYDVNPPDVNLMQRPISPLPTVLVPMYGKVSGGTFWLDLSHPTEDTMPITKPATGTFIGLQVHGNTLEDFRLFNGDKLLVELTDKALQDELVLLKEGDEFTINRYNKGKEKRDVVGVIRKRVSDI